MRHSTRDRSNKHLEGTSKNVPRTNSSGQSVGTNKVPSNRLLDECGVAIDLLRSRKAVKSVGFESFLSESLVFAVGDALVLQRLTNFVFDLTIMIHWSIKPQDHIYRFR
jgi:hypothetical protein